MVWAYLKIALSYTSSLKVNNHKIIEYYFFCGKAFTFSISFLQNNNLYTLLFERINLVLYT